MECPICGYNQNIFVRKWAKGYDALKCRNCNLIFASPMKGLNSIYDQAYEEGNEYNVYLEMAKTLKIKGRRALGWPYKTLLRYIKNKDLCGETIFEVGCGCGHFIYLMNSLGYESNGCDISSSACRVAKGMFNLDIINSEFNEATIDEKTLDMVIAFELIEHLEDPLKFLKVVQSKLKHGGYLFLSTPNAETKWPVQWQQEKTVFPPFHLTIFSKKSLSVVAEKVGFEVVDFIQKPIPFRYEFMEENFSKPRLVFEALKSYLKGEKGVTLFCAMKKL